MPYKRTYKKKKFGPKRLVKKRIYKRKTLGGLLPRPNNRPESKFVDATFNSVNGCSTTGALSLLNGIAQGLTDSGRIGNKITIKSIYIKMSVVVGTVYGAWRVLVIVDKQASGVAPSLGLAGVNSFITEISTRGHVDLNNRSRFVILKDIKGSTTPTDRPSVNFNWYKKLDMPVIFEGTGATIASISSGSIYVVCMGDNTAGVTCPSLYVHSRIRYTDS